MFFFACSTLYHVNRCVCSCHRGDQVSSTHKRGSVRRGLVCSPVRLPRHGSAFAFWRRLGPAPPLRFNGKLDRWCVCDIVVVVICCLTFARLQNTTRVAPVGVLLDSLPNRTHPHVVNLMFWCLLLQMRSESGSSSARATRLMRELRSLRSSLPLTPGSSVFLRYDKKRPFIIQVLLIVVRPEFQLSLSPVMHALMQLLCPRWTCCRTSSYFICKHNSGLLIVFCAFLRAGTDQRPRGHAVRQWSVLV